MAKKGTLSSPMTMPHPMPKVKGTETVDPTTGPKGPVNKIAKDVLSGPMQGPRSAATGERESELGKTQGF